MEVSTLFVCGDSCALGRTIATVRIWIFNIKVSSTSEATAAAAMIPPELANCVADYAERICAG